MEEQRYVDYFAQNKATLEKYQGITLLKSIESIANDIFKTSPDYEASRTVLGNDSANIERVLKACNDVVWQGIEDFSEDFYKVYESGCTRQRLIRGLTLLAIDNLNHGFSDFDSALISYSAKIQNQYDVYYKEWMVAVRSSEAATKIIEMQKDDPDTLNVIVKDLGLDNPYTILTTSEEGGETFLSHTPYAVYFAESVKNIGETFKSMIAALEATAKNDDHKLVIKHLAQYQKCLQETDLNKLIPEWVELDRVWMDSTYWIQIVHEMESDYGDPLRVKVIPDYSIRFLDTEREEDNKEIQEVKKQLQRYYQTRTGPVADTGKYALDHSNAGLYYMPFMSAMDIHFKFAGQSIPNREEVKRTHGVKVYFDPIALEKRAGLVMEAVEKVYADKTMKTKVDTKKFLLEHLPAHEFGHAIYNMDAASDFVKQSTKSLLEESRADLTGYTMLSYDHKTNRLEEKEILSAMFTTACFDLRRFAMWDSQSLKPYIYSAMNSYKAFEKTSYLYIKDDALHLDESKAWEALEMLQKQFDGILDAIESKDGKALDNELEKIQETSPMIEWLVSKLFKK